jgi:hypothetical protein
MQITAVDNELNLFQVTQAVSDDLVENISKTDWVNLPWDRQPGQESWPRRRIRNQSLSWIKEWDNYFYNIWPEIEKTLGGKLQPYCGTAFWLDEPGFVCNMHTDGEMPGSLHLNWIGPATCFYWYNDPKSVRYQALEVPNTGYIMINRDDSLAYRKLLWHSMSTPVPANTIRLTSYTWLNLI